MMVAILRATLSRMPSSRRSVDNRRIRAGIDDPTAHALPAAKGGTRRDAACQLNPQQRFALARHADECAEATNGEQVSDHHRAGVPTLSLTVGVHADRQRPTRFLLCPLCGEPSLH